MSKCNRQFRLACSFSRSRLFLRPRPGHPAYPTRISPSLLRYSTKQRQDSCHGVPYRFHIHNSPELVSAVTSRGERANNEDRWKSEILSVPCPEYPQTQIEVYWFGVYDGHGGSACSQFLQDRLHEIFKTVKPSALPSILNALTQEYNRPVELFYPPFKSFPEKEPLTLDQRLYLGFLSAEAEFLQTHRKMDTCGSTATVAIVRPLEMDVRDGLEKSKVDLCVGHVGDSRIVLCKGLRGEAQALSEAHHPMNPVEHARIHALGGFTTPNPTSPNSELVLGALAVSRCIGDLKYKRYGGVVAEPAVQTIHLTDEDQAAFITLVTDGVCGVATDDEIIDVAKTAPTFAKSASTVLAFADALGSTDNKTCINVRLPHYPDHPFPDLTKGSREARIHAHSRRRRSDENALEASDPAVDVERITELDKEKLETLLKSIFSQQNLDAETLMQRLRERSVCLNLDLGQEQKKDERCDNIETAVKRTFKVLDAPLHTPIRVDQAVRGFELLGVKLVDEDAEG
ncbi:phosphatase 2C-like domain-containing protein [Gaertneriomyces semiglobifer]|nr:phosphatase 2C-like domain-containing protein [Gaertneriomyces semiglobifer]